MTRVRVLLAIAALAAIPGCGVQGLNFTKDDRLAVITPDDRAKVTLPVTIEWTVERFEVTGRDGARRRNAGYFGIYVDRPPQPPGRTQEWIVRDDQRCRSAPGCPDEAFLAQLDVHATTELDFTIDRLPLPSDSAVRRREFHEVTLVLLNGRGERIGESASIVQFEVDRG